VLSQVNLVPHHARFLEAHRQLAAAIAAGQPTKARRLALEHVQDMMTVVAAQASWLLDRTIEWR
jgi:DNA-binding FadR family transcriptional regulator